MGRTVVMSLEADIAPCAVSELCGRLRALLDSQDPDLVVFDVAALVDPGIAAVEALARLRLTAKRAGRAVELRHLGARLRELLTLVGLDQVMPCGDERPGGPGGSGAGALGQAEVGEQDVDVEEVVQPGDPSV